MSFREHLSTILFAGLIALLIWFWAEGENRVSDIVPAEVTFEAGAMSDRFLVRAKGSDDEAPFQEELAARLEIEGPNVAVQRFRSGMPPLVVPIDNPRDGEQIEINLRQRLENHPFVIEHGINVLSVSPSVATIRVDELVTRQVKISPELPDVKVESISITPDQVQVSMTRTTWESIVRPAYGENFLRLDISESRLREIPPGEPTSLENVGVQVAEDLRQLSDEIRVGDVEVDVTLTLSGQLLEIAWQVPVKVSKPVTDELEYAVQVDPSYALLRDVIISGEAERIRPLEQREIRVFAILNLSSEDLERQITEKRVEWLLPEGLEAQMGEAAEPPVIPIEITERPVEESPDA